MSKTLWEKREKPPPYDYQFNDVRWWTVDDATTSRLDENSKLIVVEGAHAVGKTELAKKLADEFEMKYIPPPNIVEEIYTGPYGIDYRKYNNYYPDWFKCWEEKDFFRDPTQTPDPGTCDRFMYEIYKLKFEHQLNAIVHILNTGQGVVMEGCANSDYIHFEAAYRQGWVQHESKYLQILTMKFATQNRTSNFPNF